MKSPEVGFWEKLDAEIKRSLAHQRLQIGLAAYWANVRIEEMHTVGSGVCFCGDSMDNHSAWENHFPREMPIDKGRVSPEEEKAWLEQSSTRH